MCNIQIPMHIRLSQSNLSQPCEGCQTDCDWAVFTVQPYDNLVPRTFSVTR